MKVDVKEVKSKKVERIDNFGPYFNCEKYVEFNRLLTHELNN